ncbi:hypothetical protein [Collinsella intestinalis]|uniref:hypothetical protein n=1 Tax=Collinsella intestinalis TaxID=147207 RepID=UPI0025A395AC|nr:hypothetical protein [Collinsella intestinalis]MDM8163689.1 hypothetical protein [Collinsella intestinalis]
MEAVLAAAVTGVLTLIGVIVSNSRSKAVLELKIDTLSERVRQHNEVVSRTYALEQQMAVARNDIETLYHRAKEAS